MDDETLVKRAANGDRRSFEILVRRHAGAIVNYLRRFLPDPDDAEDIAQETFVLAWRNLARFDPGLGLFKSWLFRIATNSGLNELKRRERAAAREEAAGELLHPEHQQPPGGTEIRELREILQSALQTLPAGERQIVLLSYYHDLTYSQISHILEIPIGTVKSRMHSAMARLRSSLVPSKAGELR